MGVGVGTASGGDNLGAIRATAWCDPSLTLGADVAGATDGEVSEVAVKGFGAGAGVTVTTVATGSVGTVAVTAMGSVGTLGAGLP